MVTPERAVDVANEAFGRHPGYRALHAKGVVCRGSFRATPEAAKLTRAAHMQGEPVEAIVRFSNASGDPGWPDYTPDVRGMAVGMKLPDGERTDIVSQTSPRFPNRTPEGFVDLMRANGGTISKLWKVPLFLATHPRVIPTLPGGLAGIKTPASYASCPFYAIHAFKWIDAEGGTRHVRYTWLPEDDDPDLSRGAARKLGRDYLGEEIAARLERSAARFALQLQIAAEGDKVDDPSSAWPADRESLKAGTLEVTALAPEIEEGGLLVLDPTKVTDGIELTDDPVLRFRAPAYSESVNRRTSSA